ncbi:MAG: hypothetical protein ACK5MQ_18240 [Pikeienuella sp.]
MTTANILIGFGILAANAGLLGLVWCILLARRVQTGRVPHDQLETVFKRLSLINMASIGGAMFGLALVLAGFMIG